MLTRLKIATEMIAAFAASGVGLPTLSTLGVMPNGAASARACLPPFLHPATSASATDSQQVAKVYPLKHAGVEHVAVLLRGLFVVVNEQDPYVRFYVDKQTNSLIVGGSRQHQRQIGWVLAVLDRPDEAPAQVVERGEAEQAVKGYPLPQADGEAVVAVLRSLFLVVNHRAAYARFVFDARTGLLIAVASPKHQKQIARVLELLKAQTRPARQGAKEDDAEQEVHVYPIEHPDGARLIGKLRSQFVVVNHQQAEVRFGFDERTHLLIVIAAEKLRGKIHDSIAAFD